MSKSATEPCSSGSLRAVLWDLAQERAGRFSGAAGVGSLDGQSDFNTGQREREVALHDLARDRAAVRARVLLPAELPHHIFAYGKVWMARRHL